MQKIEIGKKYKHYKGNIYEIIAFAKHSETTEDMIIYKSIKDGQTWARPRNMWNDKINEQGELRFTLVE